MQSVGNQPGPAPAPDEDNNTQQAVTSNEQQQALAGNEQQQAVAGNEQQQAIPPREEPRVYCLVNDSKGDASLDFFSTHLDLVDRLELTCRPRYISDGRALFTSGSGSFRPRAMLALDPGFFTAFNVSACANVSQYVQRGGIFVIGGAIGVTNINGIFRFWFPGIRWRARRPAPPPPGAVTPEDVVRKVKPPPHDGEALMLGFRGFTHPSNEAFPRAYRCNHYAVWIDNVRRRDAVYVVDEGQGESESEGEGEGEESILQGMQLVAAFANDLQGLTSTPFALCRYGHGLVGFVGDYGDEERLSSIIRALMFVI